MTVKELIDYLETNLTEEQMNKMVLVRSLDPFKMVSGVISIENVYMGKTEFPAILIHEKIE